MQATIYFIMVAFLLPFLICLAACTDLTSYKIYNWLNLALIVMFLPCALIMNFSLEQYFYHFIGFLVVLAGGIVLFAIRLLGGGDVKFAAAISLWFGYNNNLTEFLIMSFLFGGILALFLLQFRSVVLPQVLSRYKWILVLHAPKGDVPYGIALAAGALYILPSTTWFAPFIK